MTPQPLTSLLHKVPKDGLKLFDFTAAAIDHKPDLAIFPMRVIATWASIDALIFQMASGFLRSEPEMVARMLVALTGSEARRAAVRALADSALTDDPEGLRLFTAVMKAMGPSRERRNEYAHHLWAYWSGIPDALLLFPERHVVIQDARLNAVLWGREDLGFEEPFELWPEHLYDTDAIMVYRLGDFERDLRDARKAYDLMEWLLRALSKESAARDQARNELLKEPLVQQALQPPFQETAP